MACSVPVIWAPRKADWFHPCLPTSTCTMCWMSGLRNALRSHAVCKACLVRYADDFVACFHREEDAKRFMMELNSRLADFNLEAEPTKTRVLRFGGQAQAQCKQEGLRRPQTFNFLGLTHFVGRSRSGRFVVGRQTQGDRARKKLKALNVRLMELRTSGGKAMRDYVRRHLQGHIQYFGVSGNSRSLEDYVRRAGRLLFKWLNRRSQRRSVTWARFESARRPVSAAPADHPSPLSRTAVDDSDWEPDGLTIHVRFCEGGGTYQVIGIPAATLQPMDAPPYPTIMRALHFYPDSLVICAI